MAIFEISRILEMGFWIKLLKAISRCNPSGDIAWTWGTFGADLEDGLFRLFLSQGISAVFSCIQ